MGRASLCFVLFGPKRAELELVYASTTVTSLFLFNPNCPPFRDEPSHSPLMVAQQSRHLLGVGLGVGLVGNKRHSLIIMIAQQKRRHLLGVGLRVGLVGNPDTLS